MSPSLDTSVDVIWSKFERLREMRSELHALSQQSDSTAWSAPYTEDVSRLAFAPIRSELHRLATIASDIPARTEAERSYKAMMLREYLDESPCDLAHKLAASLVKDITSTW